jgi:hypothetical protein
MPDQITWLEVHGIRVGGASVDLRLDRPRSGSDEPRVEILGLRGKLDVQVDYVGTAGSRSG